MADLEEHDKRLVTLAAIPWNPDTRAWNLGEPKERQLEEKTQDKKSTRSADIEKPAIWNRVFSDPKVIKYLCDSAIPLLQFLILVLAFTYPEFAIIFSVAFAILQHFYCKYQVARSIEKEEKQLSTRYKISKASTYILRTLLSTCLAIGLIFATAPTDPAVILYTLLPVMIAALIIRYYQQAKPNEESKQGKTINKQADTFMNRLQIAAIIVFAVIFLSLQQFSDQLSLFILIVLLALSVVAVIHRGMSLVNHIAKDPEEREKRSVSSRTVTLNFCLQVASTVISAIGFIILQGVVLGSLFTDTYNFFSGTPSVLILTLITVAVTGVKLLRMAQYVKANALATEITDYLEHSLNADNLKLNLQKISSDIFEILEKAQKIPQLYGSSLLLSAVKEALEIHHLEKHEVKIILTYIRKGIAIDSGITEITDLDNIDSAESQNTTDVNSRSQTFPRRAINSVTRFFQHPPVDEEGIEFTALIPASM